MVCFEGFVENKKVLNIFRYYIITVSFRGTSLPRLNQSSLGNPGSNATDAKSRNLLKYQGLIALETQGS